MSLRDMEILESQGRYDEVIQMGNKLTDYYVDIRIIRHIIYSEIQLGNYMAAIATCDAYVNNINDGRTPQDRERDISDFRNLALKMLRGNKNTYDDPIVQQPRMFEEGYIPQVAQNVMDDTSGINSW